MKPFEFLTLHPNEARLIVAALNGHLRGEGIAAYDELRLSIGDSCGPDAEGGRLDEMYEVGDWRMFVQRIYSLTEAQAASVLNAAASFWDAGGDSIEEQLADVGLL